MITKKHGYKLHDKFQVINDEGGADMPLFSVISGSTSKHGYKLHDKFQVINDEGGAGYYNVGMIVELVIDDGTDIPLFSVISGSTSKYRPDGTTCYIKLDHVQLLNKKEQKALGGDELLNLLELYIEQHYSKDAVLKQLVTYLKGD